MKINIKQLHVAIRNGTSGPVRGDSIYNYNKTNDITVCNLYRQTKAEINGLQFWGHIKPLNQRIFLVDKSLSIDEISKLTPDHRFQFNIGSKRFEVYNYKISEHEYVDGEYKDLGVVDPKDYGIGGFVSGERTGFSGENFYSWEPYLKDDTVVISKNRSAPVPQHLKLDEIDELEIKITGFKTTPYFNFQKIENGKFKSRWVVATEEGIDIPSSAERAGCIVCAEVKINGEKLYSEKELFAKNVCDEVLTREEAVTHPKYGEDFRAQIKMYEDAGETPESFIIDCGKAEVGWDSCNSALLRGGKLLWPAPLAPISKTRPVLPRQIPRNLPTW